MRKARRRPRWSATRPPSSSSTDVVILGTAAPHPLIDTATLRAAGDAGGGSVVLVDLSLPRNVDPAVRELGTVRLLDLDDLRAAGSDNAGTLAEDVAAAGAVVEEELARYQRWLAARSAADAVGRLRADSDAVAREEVERLAERLPADVRGLVEQAVGRAVRRLAHGPTRLLLAAGQAGDDALVGLLAGLFGDAGAATARGGARPSPTDDARAAAPVAGPGLDAQRGKVRTDEQTGHGGSVHAADQFAM
ncbi:MAG: hypothetical protein ACXV3C_03775 [Actinomycetes bacterium]